MRMAERERESNTQTGKGIGLMISMLADYVAVAHASYTYLEWLASNGTDHSGEG